MDFFKTYFDYVGASEAPMIYHRWTAISILGTILGRNVWFPFGHSKIYPNQYIMLMGPPGARKGTAMNIGKKLLQEAGYNRFAPDKVSKERFLMEFKPYSEEELEADLIDLVFDAPAELYAFAEEFTDLVGQNNTEFLTMLTKLWDNMNEYKHPKIHGSSVVIERPTLNLFGGNTVQGLALAMPPEALGNGFMSRMLFVHSEATGIKIPFPKPVNPELKKELVAHLKFLREEMLGEISYDKDAEELLDRMYREFVDVDDHRFKHYSSRRFTHLLKLCTILTVSNSRTVITGEDALNANTLLHFTELRMPKALGEFGRSKYSEVSHAILEILNHAVKPMTVNELWKHVAKDLSKINELGDVLKNLLGAEKIQVATMQGKQGYLPLYKEAREWDESLLNKKFLREEELM